MLPQQRAGSDDVAVVDQDGPGTGAGSHRVGDVTKTGGAQRVGGNTGDLNIDRAAGGQGRIERGNGGGLHPDHAGPPFGSSSDPGHQPAPAHGQQHRVELAASVLQQFEAECSLPGADLGLVVGMAQQRAGLGGVLSGRFVEVGVESASPAVLARLAKGVSPDVNVAAPRMLRRLGIGVALDFIMIDPASTLHDLELNLNFLEENGFLDYYPHEHLYNSLALYEGTPIRSYFEKRLGRAFPLGQLPEALDILEDKEAVTFWKLVQSFNSAYQSQIEGIPLWVSDVLPGNVHDLAAARENVLGVLRPFLDAMPVLAELGYEGAGRGVHVPVKKQAWVKELDTGARARSALIRSARCRGERGSALLTQRWRTLQHVTASPWENRSHRQGRSCAGALRAQMIR